MRHGSQIFGDVPVSDLACNIGRIAFDRRSQDQSFRFQYRHDDPAFITREIKKGDGGPSPS
jgi:hypothetical protein